MTQVLIDRATLEQMMVALEKLLQDVRAVNASGSYGELLRKNITPASKALTAGRAALANAERAGPDAQLCKFYDVATYPELVAAMEKHITKLQARTPPLTGESFTQKPRFA